MLRVLSLFLTFLRLLVVFGFMRSTILCLSNTLPHISMKMALQRVLKVMPRRKTVACSDKS